MSNKLYAIVFVKQASTMGRFVTQKPFRNSNFPLSRFKSNAAIYGTYSEAMVAFITLEKELHQEPGSFHILRCQ